MDRFRVDRGAWRAREERRQSGWKGQAQAPQREKGIGKAVEFLSGGGPLSGLPLKEKKTSVLYSSKAAQKGSKVRSKVLRTITRGQVKTVFS